MIRHETEAPVVVVGGGLGGLAAACVLAARGHRVALYERNGWLGGKAAVLHEQGYRFDMGPTILTMPRVLRRIFAEADRKLDDYLDLVQLEPQWRCFFDDGKMLDLHGGAQAMDQSLERFGVNPTGRADYQEFIEYAERQHRISEHFFFWRSVGGMREIFDFKQALKLGTLGDVMSMRMGRSMAGTIRRFIDEPHVAQMLDHFTQYVGSSPFLAPSVLCGIAHMQTDEGVWYPMGGTRAVPEALVRLANELDVELTCNMGVKRICTERDRVRGVVLDDGSEVAASAVVSNMDSVRTHRELLDHATQRHFEQRRRHEPACSGVVLYLGLNQRYDHLAHHDFVFSRDPEEEFDAIYAQGEPAPDPTAYLAAPSNTEPGVAPEGGEALYVLVHTPYLRPHHDWSADGPLFGSYRRTILEKLKRTAGLEDIERRIVFERALTPRDIHDRYAVLDGAIYGLASHGKFTGAFKPANRSPDVQGLYLVGGAAHPGPGMPMVLMSGWIGADALDADVRHVEPAAENQTVSGA